MKHYFLWTINLLLFLGAAQLSAQQAPQYSHYMLNPYAYNTGFAGLDRSLSITGAARRQWTGLIGSPASVNFNAHLPINYINSGVGFGVEYDEIGAENNIHLNAAYNYIFDLGEDRKLSIGANLGFVQKTLDGTLLRAPDGIYEGGIDHSDSQIPFTRVSDMDLTIGAGLFYRSERWQAGLGLQHLNAPTLSLAVGTDGTTEINYTRNFFLTFQYNWELNPTWTLRPGFLLKSDLGRIQPEVSVLAEYNEQFFAGLSYRGYNQLTSDAVVVLAGFQLTDNLSMAYSYDWSIGGLQNYNSGSHELTLNYNLNQPIGTALPPKIIYNPRFL